jgi:hypothetical protein
LCTSRVAAGQRRQHRVRRERVLEIAEGEEIVLPFQDIAEIVGIGAIGQHVRDLEARARLGIWITGHHDAEFFPAEIVRPRLAVPDPFDPALRVAE